MAIKTIKVPVTLHIPNSAHVPFEWNEFGAVKKGNYSVDVIPPMAPATIDAAEADILLARYKDKGAVEVTAAPAAAKV